MTKIFAATAAFLTMAFFAVSASAVTTVTNGGTYTIAAGDQFDADVIAGLGGGSWSVQFDSAGPLLGSTTAAIGVNNFFTFSGLVASWVSVGTGLVVNSLVLTSGTNTLATLFSNPDNLSQFLVFTWTRSSGRFGGFDITIEAAAVPLPAGFLLMGTALAGLGLVGRRRKKLAA